MSTSKNFLGRARAATWWFAHEIAATIRWGAEPNAVGRSLNQSQGGGDVPASIGGAMASGAGRRIGAESAKGSHTDVPED